MHDHMHTSLCALPRLCSGGDESYIGSTLITEIMGSSMASKSTVANMNTK